MELLPRVVKPPMFAKGGHILGDLRVFERFTVAPLSALTASFMDLKAGERSEKVRLIPSMTAYILEGSGTCVQDGQSYPFSANDVVVIPPYTTQEFIADSKTGFRAWLPQVRLWHVLGLLWQEQFDFKSIPEGTLPIKDNAGQLVGFKVPALACLAWKKTWKCAKAPTVSAKRCSRRAAREARRHGKNQVRLVSRSTG
jgi:hypothetical protein